MDLMTPARSEPKRHRTRRQTAESNGCLSGFLLPPLAALCVSGLLALFVAGFANAPAEQVSVPAPASPQLQQAPVIPAAAGTCTISALFTPEIQFWGASLS